MSIARYLAHLAVVVLVAATSACDGGDSTSPPSPSASPAPLSAERASALARAGVLLASELPGYSVEPQQTDAEEDESERRIGACLGLPVPTHLARDPGRAFNKDDVEITSSADVVVSEAAAQADLAAFTGPKAVACLTAELKRVVAAGFGGPVHTAEIMPVDITASVPDAFAYRLMIRVTSEGEQVRLSGYLLGAVVGPVQLTLEAIDRTGGEGVTQAQAVALLKNVTDRVRDTA